MLLLIGLAPGALAAQNPIYDAARGGGGVEVRTYSFSEGIALQRATQVTVPLFGGVPVGRHVFVDLTGSYALTTLASYDGATSQLAGLTDTQLRASYTPGRNTAVFSAAVNLPTGQSQVSASQFAVIRSAGQNFLPFPVSTYGTGLGLTLGAAGAKRFGEWSVAVAGSLRYLGRYEPFSDVQGDYAPGLESRIRLGVRRPIGERSTVAAGFTFSTYGTDEFTGVPAFVYRPGNRYIVELAFAHQVQRVTIRAAGWLYSRFPGDSGGASVEKAKERIDHGSLLAEVPLSRNTFLEAGTEGRLWQAADSNSGHLVGLRLAVRRRFAQAGMLVVTLRAETGWIRLDVGESRVGGFGSSVYFLFGT